MYKFIAAVGWCLRKSLLCFIVDACGCGQSQACVGRWRTWCICSGFSKGPQRGRYRDKGNGLLFGFWRFKRWRTDDLCLETKRKESMREAWQHKHPIDDWNVTSCNATMGTMQRSQDRQLWQNHQCQILCLMTRRTFLKNVNVTNLSH